MESSLLQCEIYFWNFGAQVYRILCKQIQMKRNTKKIELPQMFAQKLLDCEIEYKLSDVPSKEIVKSLIEYYTIGVEYYESIRSHKYLYFQIKMNEIFTSANTISAINEQSNTAESQSPLRKKMKSAQEQEKIHALQIKQKQEKMFQTVAENTSESATVSTVKKMINENDLKSIQTSEKVKKQIENQDMKLQEKLKKRKSRLLFSKSFSSSFMGENDTQDTLFTDININENEIKPGVKIQPIQVSFSNIINQDESDEEQGGRKRRLSISQDPSKKARIEMQAAIKPNKKQ